MTIIKSEYVYVVPVVDSARGRFYLDYAVREAGKLFCRSEIFDSVEGASERLLAIQAEIGLVRKQG